jgi:hypothetical protein
MIIRMSFFVIAVFVISTIYRFVSMGSIYYHHHNHQMQPWMVYAWLPSHCCLNFITVKNEIDCSCGYQRHPFFWSLEKRCNRQKINSFQNGSTSRHNTVATTATTTSTTFDEQRLKHPNCLNNRRHFLWTTLCTPILLTLDSKMASARGLVYFPCRTPLANSYHLMRVGITLLEEEGKTQKNTKADKI